MKAWQKVQVSPRLFYVMFFGAALFVIGAVAVAVFSWPGKTPCGHEQNAQPQPTPPAPDRVKPPTADVPKENEETTTKPNEEQSTKPKAEEKESIKPPRNVLGDIYDNIHGGMTVAELDAVVAKQALYRALKRPYIQKQHMPPEESPPNGMDVEIRVWTWEDREDEHGDRWVTELAVDIFDGVVAGRVYNWRQEVNRGRVWK